MNIYKIVQNNINQQIKQCYQSNITETMHRVITVVIEKIADKTNLIVSSCTVPRHAPTDYYRTARKLSCFDRFKAVA